MPNHPQHLCTAGWAGRLLLKPASAAAEVKDVAARQPLRHRKCVFLNHPFCRRVHFLSADDAHVVDGKLFSHCVWQQVQRPHCPPGLNKVIDPFDKRRKGGTEVANNVQREAVKVHQD